MLRKCRMVASRNQGCSGRLLGAGRREPPSQQGPRERWLCGSACSRFRAAFRSPVLLVLLVCCAGCASQPILHQPASASSSLGTAIHLVCTLSSDHDINIYNIYWYQQRPGHPPRFLLRYFSHLDKHHGPGISPRFSGSKNMARNQGYLRISELQPEDEAMYYCAMGVPPERDGEREGPK